MRKAFTLIELAIVIVIIGLITGGVLGGKSLIESSLRQNLVKDYKKYYTAILAFKLEYDALPGDFLDATDYWGAVSGDCRYVSGSGTETCDGDGDNFINYLSGETPLYESNRLWEHLSFAEIVKAEYLGGPIDNQYGCTGSNAFCALAGETHPEGPVSGSIWNVFSNYKTSASQITQGAAALRGENFFALGNPSNSSSGTWLGNSLTPRQMSWLDNKIDDGKPMEGGVVILLRNYAGTGLDCLRTSFAPQYQHIDHADAIYELDIDEITCLPLIKADF